MTHFIVRYRGSGQLPDADVAFMRAWPHVQVLDVSTRMVLVAAPEADVHALAASLPGWEAIPELQYSLPDPQPRL